MISKNGIVSVYGFLLGLSVLVIFFLLRSGVLQIYENINNVSVVHLFVVYAIIANILVRIINRSTIYKVSNNIIDLIFIYIDITTML